MAINSFMSLQITCYTLFDITHTGVINRPKPSIDQDPDLWLKNRNTQCNFDTILQVISLRSQPDILDYPTKQLLKFDTDEKFGFLYQQEEDKEYSYWSFTFEIQHPSVFNNGDSELGSLYDDCDGVPMILCGEECSQLATMLDTSPELRNIYFKINE